MTNAIADTAWTDRSTSRWKRRRTIGFALILISLAIWFLPQDVPRMIAEQDDILLGRYSVDRATMLLVLTPVLWLMAKGIGWPAKKRRPVKHVAFAVVALLIVLLPSLVIVEVALRKMAPPRYVEEEVALLNPPAGEPKTEVIRRRPSATSIVVTYEDVPPTARSYPSAPPGHPPVMVRLSTDALGFRNPVAIGQADIVCLGDSFTEGSRVDDRETWPVLLAKHTGSSTYNLGMSGGGPRFYLVTLEKYGLALSPKTVLCMIYAGNDFKSEEAEAGMDNETGLVARVKNSLIRTRIKQAMIQLLGPIGADASVPESEALSWMPLKVIPVDRPGAGPKLLTHYAFPPKRLQRLYVTEESFRKSKDWSAAADVFGRIIETCKAKNVRIVLVFAPSAPQVVMPVAKDRIPASALRAFLGYRIKDLPAAEELKTQVFERLDVQEKMVAELCKEKGADFVSLTQPLREAASRGVQVYYTYDQHWTAKGQAIAAEAIAKHLKE